MKRLLSLVVAGGIAASLVTVLAGPASAGTTARVFFVQGVPAKTLDICVNGDEVKSDFAYRKKFVVDLDVPADPTAYQIDVYRANDNTTCGGFALASHTYNLLVDKNYTIVAGIGVGSHQPRLFIFGNPIQNTKPGMARLSLRHTADIGAINASLVRVKTFRGIPNGGSVTGVFDDSTYTLRVRGVGSSTDLLRPRHLRLLARMAYQVYVVGDEANGYGTVTLRQAVVRPSH